jgi:CRP-like cAMP-binding protein
MKTEKLVKFFCSTNVISTTTATEIVKCFKQKSVGKNEFLLKEGKISDHYYFIETGFLRAFAIDTEGNEVTTGFYGTGNLVFEVSSFFTRQPARENIQALTDCTGLYLTYEQLNHLFHSLQEFREFGRSILVKGYAALKDRMLSMITETAEERYESLLKSNPEIFQNAPLKYIASYLGITDTSLSRIRKDYSKKHLLH